MPVTDNVTEVEVVVKITKESTVFDKVFISSYFSRFALVLIIHL